MSESTAVLRRPFGALWVMMIGLFLIVVDSTVVAIANPVLKDHFAADYDAVLWVTSGYLLAFAALLLLGGRLGDRYGPKRVYVLGLAVFSLCSLWCAVASTLEMLTVARVVQGAGAALLAPQIFAMITRTFPPDRRGVAMSVWGATTGVGLFAGPIAGGFLLDELGWRWIFFVNVPIGAVGLALAVWSLPALPGRRLRLDIPGVLLSGAGICLIVFGLQEGERAAWSPWIWLVIAGGLALIAAFVGRQAAHPDEPLIPLPLLWHRNFMLSTAGIGLASFAFVAFMIPLMIYLEEVGGLSPIRAALLTAPMAAATVVLAPIVGKVVDRIDPLPMVIGGFVLLAVALCWLSREMMPDTAVWRLVLPLAAVGAAGALTWEPLAVIASRALSADLAGAGSALCHTARHLGAALSSASIAALMGILSGGSVADVTSRSMVLPAAAAAAGVIAALLLVHRQRPAAPVLATNSAPHREATVL